MPAQISNSKREPAPGRTATGHATQEQAAGRAPGPKHVQSSRKLQEQGHRSIAKTSISTGRGPRREKIIWPRCKPRSIESQYFWSCWGIFDGEAQEPDEHGFFVQSEDDKTIEVDGETEPRDDDEPSGAEKALTVAGETRKTTGNDDEPTRVSTDHARVFY